MSNIKQPRMTTFIKRSSRYQMIRRILKYRLAANITEFISQRISFLNWSRNNQIMLELKMPKSSCLKWAYGRSSIDYRVASLFTRIGR